VHYSKHERKQKTATVFLNQDSVRKWDFAENIIRTHRRHTYNEYINLLNFCKIFQIFHAGWPEICEVLNNTGINSISSPTASPLYGLHRLGLWGYKFYFRKSSMEAIFRKYTTLYVQGVQEVTAIAI
jgi:hypothetical protein